MNGMPVPPPARFATALALVAAATAGIAAIALAGAASPKPAAQESRQAIDAIHLPPLLRVPGEPVRLRFDPVCLGQEAEAPEEGCPATGSVFIRSQDGGVVQELPLLTPVEAGERYLFADVPEELASAPSGFTYDAVIRSGGASVRLPPGGGAAPYVSLLMKRAIRVEIGKHAFGAVREPDGRVASAAWGSGRDDVGLEPGRVQSAMGASAFDVDAAGRVYVLDEAHHRILEWSRSSRGPTRVPVSVSGTIADLAVDSDGSIYVLETVGEPGGRPLVRRFDDGGRELEAVELAERTASQIRLSPDGPVVHEQPAQQWMPIMPGGVPAGRAEQLGRARASRAVRGGKELTVERIGGEIRVAIVGPSGAQRAWRIVSESPLAEVQLAEPLGNRVLVVARVFTDESDEFLVLVLGDRGLVDTFSVAPHDWAEAAPLGRFKLVGDTLFQLGSTSSGAFVDRYDMGGRR